VNSEIVIEETHIVTALIFIFRRSNNDLIMRMNIELVEALCGFQRVIKTLDDRDLVVTAIPGELYCGSYNPFALAVKVV